MRKRQSEAGRPVFCVHRRRRSCQRPSHPPNTSQKGHVEGRGHSINLHPPTDRQDGRYALLLRVVAVERGLLCVPGLIRGIRKPPSACHRPTCLTPVTPVPGWRSVVREARSGVHSPDRSATQHQPPTHRAHHTHPTDPPRHHSPPADVKPTSTGQRSPRTPRALRTRGP